jgi:curved DNA-binding protein
MKYKDYYEILGIKRDAGADDIKKAYRKLAHKYHPDVSKDPKGEEKFKDVSEAYKTLKDPEAKAAYDRLGSHRPGEDFQPPPDWGQQFGGGGGNFSFDDIDLADLFGGLGGRGAGFRGGGQRGANFPIPGQDYEVAAPITVEDAYRGTELDLNLSVPEYDEQGRMRRVPLTLKARIPKGVTEGERLRLPGKGGKGINGGPNGSLFLTIALQPHPLYRVTGHDLYLDLPLAPWEAAIGTSVEVPTLGGPVRLKIPAGTNTGQKLRLAKRGLPKRREGEGDLFAIAQIVVPPSPSEREKELFKELAEASKFNPRASFPTGDGT